MSYSMKLIRRTQVAILASLTFACVSGCNRESSNEAIGHGQNALQNGDYPAAIRHLKRAVKLNPSNEILYFNLGMAQLLSKDYPSAITAFDQAEKLNIDGNTEALEGLAEARRQLGDYAGAIQAFERAIEKVNRKAHLVAGMAVCEMEQGNDENAYELLQQALGTDNHEPVALFNMAVLMQKPKYNEPQKAAELYARFLLESNNKSTYPKECARAIEAIKTIGANRSAALQMQVDDLMMAAKTTKSPAEALKQAAEAVRLDQSNPDALWELLERLAASGHKKDAAAIRLRFQTIFPDDPRSKR